MRTAALLVGAVAAFFVCAPPASATPADERGELVRRLNHREFSGLETALTQLQRDYEAQVIPEDDVYERFIAFRLPEADTEAVDEWVKTSPRSYPARLAAAFHYQDLGWRARGDAYARETTPARFRDAEKFFGQAMGHAEASLPLTAQPTISHVVLINLARAYHGGPEGSERLQRALQLEPRSFLARSTYFSALLPQWGGSFERMDAVIEEARVAGASERTLKRLAALKLRYLAEELEHDAAGALDLLDRSIALDETAIVQARRAEALAHGLGRIPEARRALERAAALGMHDSKALLVIGGWHLRHREKAAALDAYKRSALADSNAASAYMAGWLLEVAEADGTRNILEAYRWYALSAKLGHRDGMYAMGLCYRDGGCGEQIDYAKAQAWLRKAMDYGERDSLMILAEMQWEGQGTPRDLDRAAAYLAEAAQSSDGETRRAAYGSMLSRLDPPATLKALLGATGHPALAALMLAAMLLMPLATLLIAVRGGYVLSRNPRSPLAPVVPVPDRMLWLSAWALPLATGFALWAAYALGFIERFTGVLVPFAGVLLYSGVAIYRLATRPERVR